MAIRRQNRVGAVEELGFLPAPVVRSCVRFMAPFKGERFVCCEVVDSKLSSLGVGMLLAVGLDWRALGSSDLSVDSRVGISISVSSCRPVILCLAGRLACLF